MFGNRCFKNHRDDLELPLQPRPRKCHAAGMVHAILESGLVKAGVQAVRDNPHLHEGWVIQDKPRKEEFNTNVAQSAAKVAELFIALKPAWCHLCPSQVFLCNTFWVQLRCFRCFDTIALSEKHNYSYVTSHCFKWLFFIIILGKLLCKHSL